MSYQVLSQSVNYTQLLSLNPSSKGHFSDILELGNREKNHNHPQDPTAKLK
jgi:hypothetical protein